MAKSNTIQFKGTFDGSQILNELKKVRASMSEAGASDTLFKNVDKDIVATEKLVNDMMAQIQKGFSSTKEISAFEKQISKLQTNFLKISTGLKGANLSENFTFNSPEIAKLTQEINRLTAAQDRLKESSKNALATAGRNIGFNQDDVKEIQKAIDANEDLEESLIRVAKAKEKAAKANAGQFGMATDAGKEYIANAKAGLSLEDLGATAMSGKTAKGPDDARARGAGGKLKRGSKGVRLDEDKAMVAVNETYQQALEETVRNGGSAVDAVEAMKKALADYGVQLSNTERLQENFAESLEGFYTGDIVGVGQKSAVTKAQKAGRTNAQGEFELSDDARRQIIDNSQITAYNQNLERTAQAERELATERERLVERAEQAQEEYNNSLKNTDRNVEEVTNSLREQSKATKESAMSQEKLNAGFDNMKGAIKTLLSISSAANGLKNVLRSTFEDVKSLDKSFAEIAMVTDYSVGQMWESYDQYSEMANKLGQSTQGVIQASGLFYQQGLNTAESLDLTEDTMKLATLAGTDFSEATSQMTAALRGFKMEMDEGNRVTDVYSELAAKAAADVQGIAYAMSKTASIAESAGMEFETTSAFLTQMIETTQEAPENIGTAMKTIIARFTELKENIAGTDKSEFEDLDYNKVDTALKSVGVSIKDASGQFKDLDDVFLELSGKWDTLDRNTQRYIATIAAGSRQQSRFIAMMDNYDRTMELVDTAYDSAGKSSEQFAKYQDTLEYKLNQLRNTWEQFRVQFFNSDFFKGVIDSLNELLNRLNDLDLKDFSTLAVVWLTLGRSMIMNFIKGAQEGASLLTKKLTPIFEKLHHSVNNFLGTKLNLNMGLDLKDLKQKLTEAEQKYKEAERQIEDNTIVIDVDTQQALQNLDSLEAKYEQFRQEALSAEMSETEADEWANTNMGDEMDQLNRGRSARNAQQLRQEGEEALEDANRTIDQVTGDIDKAQSVAQVRGELIGQTLATSITMAITAVTTAENPMEAFGQVMITGLASLIPSLISMVTAAGGAMSMAFIASTAGIGALILGITAAITATTVGIANAWNESKMQSAENQIDQLTEKIDNLNEKINETKRKVEELSTEKKSLDEIEKSWTKLGNKTVKTTEEQAEYNSMIENIKGNYPELLTYYNEENNAAQINLTLLDQKIEKQNRLLEQEQNLLELQERQLFLAENEKTKNETIQNLTKEGGALEGYKEKTLRNNFSSTFKDKKQFEDFLENEISVYSKEELENISFLNISLDEQALIGDKISQLYPEVDTEYYQDEQGNYIDLVTMIGEEAALQEAYTAGNISQQELTNFRETFGIAIEVVEEFNDVIAEYNSDLVQIREDYRGKDEYISGAAASNLAIASRILEDDGAVAQNIAAQRAAKYQEEIFNNQKLTGKAAYDAFLKIAEEKDINTNGIIEGDSFNKLVENVTEWHIAAEKWENMSDTQRENLKAMGITEQVWKDEYEDFSDEDNQERLIAAYNAYLENQIAVLTAEGIDTTGMQEAFDTLSAEMGTMTLEQFNEEKQKIANQFQLDMDEFDTIFPQDAIDSAFENVSTTGIKGIENLSMSAVQTFSGLLDEAKLNDSQRKALGNAINDVVEGYKLNSSQINNLLQIDLSQGYQQIRGNSETYIQTLMNTGMSLEEASKTFKQYLDNIGNILGKGVFGKAGSIVFNEQIQMDVQGFKEKYAPLIEARNEMLDSEDGSISSDTYFSLIEAGFEDYVRITTNGYELIAEKAEQAWTTQAMAPLETLREQVKVNDELIKEAEEFNSKFSDSILSGNELKSLGWSDEDIASVDGQMSFNFDEQIQEYKRLLNANEDTSAALAVFGNKANFVATMVDNGYTSLQDYIQALKEGKVELSSVEADTWIQGLVNLQEASVDAKEKVQDLTDELVDLNEQLDDDKKAMDEAYQTWQDAIHGSEGYQSSLNGLFNYEKRLDSLNDKLEETKEALSDISSIEEAKDLLQNTQSLYENKLGTLQAQNKVIDQSIKNLDEEILKNYGDFVGFDEFGNMTVEIRKLEDADMSDILKDDGFTQLIEKRAEMKDKLDKGNKEILETEKAWNEQLKKAREGQIAIEKKVIDILKEKMQEEIDATNEKYAALEEADNNYLDALQEAIDKQRELREQENQYEDLATKQKKLSLMQRDTSGANQKEVQSLEKEIDEDRQSLLDSEVDNLIESMRELYEKQQEARELEIEAMEAAAENMQVINETALNIISGFQTAEDYQAWLMENDTSVEDMTVTQTEAYLDEAKKTFSGYARYVALTVEDMALRTDEINANADAVFENTSENVTIIGTTIQDLAETATDKAEAEAKEAYDDAVDKWNKTQEKITETENKLKQAEDEAVTSHSAAMDEMVKASQSGMLKVATAAAEMMIESENLDLTDSEVVQKFAESHNFYNSETNEYSKGFVNALTNKGYDTSNMIIDQQWQITGTPKGGGPTVALSGSFDTKAEAEKVLPQYQEQYKNNLDHISATPSIAAVGAYKQYATGGLVNYTGPAWVDGTPSKPEAFLSAQDTERIGNAAKLLADLPILNSTSNANNVVSSNIGDTSIEIHINVESLASDYDVDQMIERVKNDILDVSKPTGTSVILHK